MKGCLPTLLSQVLAVAAALGGSNPEPQSVATIVVKWLPLSNRRGRLREKVSAACRAEQGRLDASRGWYCLTSRSTRPGPFHLTGNLGSWIVCPFPVR